MAPSGPPGHPAGQPIVLRHIYSKHHHHAHWTAQIIQIIHTANWPAVINSLKHEIRIINWFSLFVLIPDFLNLESRAPTMKNR